MNIYQHFRPEERDFIDQVLHWKDYVENAYAPRLTDFLDPREQHILKVIIGEHTLVKWDLFGGIKDAERRRAIIYPEYMEPTEEDFQISLYEVDYPSKFVTIEHPQVLGSLMSLGLKRGKYGDILFEGDRIQFLAAQEVGHYITSQLESIGRASVTLKEVAFSEAISAGVSITEQSITVSSLRLDTVVSGIHNLSRQKSQLLVQQGHVKVNWTNIENPSFECEEGDLISVRGHGRVKIISLEGVTKKEKIRIIIGKQK